MKTFPVKKQNLFIRKLHTCQINPVAIPVFTPIEILSIERLYKLHFTPIPMNTAIRLSRCESRETVDSGRPYSDAQFVGFVFKSR